MSDMGFTVPRPRISLAEALGQAPAFRPTTRFSALPEILVPHHDIAADAPDILTETYGRGYAEGHATATAEAAARMLADDRAREELALSFARLDATMAEDLRLRLRDTVAALCEAALGPLALDEVALTNRIARAVSMLTRADDERVVRLHPADIELVSARLQADWTVRPDPLLERGTVRVETATGGVEDGPAAWRLAIAEALHQA
ncbi:flagellar assembly protein FliH [Novosphingobium gossypii]